MGCNLVIMLLLSYYAMGCNLVIMLFIMLSELILTTIDSNVHPFFIP